MLLDDMAMRAAKWGSLRLYSNGTGGILTTCAA